MTFFVEIVKDSAPTEMRMSLAFKVPIANQNKSTPSRTTLRMLVSIWMPESWPFDSESTKKRYLFSSNVRMWKEKRIQLSNTLLKLSRMQNQIL